LTSRNISETKSYKNSFL